MRTNDGGIQSSRPIDSSLSWPRRDGAAALLRTRIAPHTPGALLLLVLMAIPVEGGVNHKNGGFYITYTDAVLSQQPQSDLSRTYNSTSSFQGMFGYGWGSEYETYLDVQGEGTVVIHENGGGATTTMRPPALSMAEIRATVDRIIRAEQQDGRFRDDTEYRERHHELLQDAEVRRQSWSRYVKKGLLKPRHSTPGAVYRSSQRGQQRLLRTHDGFQLTDQGSDRVKEFDASGRLIVVRKLHGNGVIFHLVRDQKGHISRIVFQNAQQWSFHMNDNGTVARIDTPTRKSSTYYYDDGRLLIGSVDVVGNRYSYDYDRRGYMNTVGYDDGSRMIITYTGTEHGVSGFVRSVTKRGGNTTWYDYGDIYDGPDGQAFFTKVTNPSPVGDIVELYEYWDRVPAGWHPL